jgi:AcrR family transcriptional regulator
MRTYGGKTPDERRAERRARLVAAGRELFGTQGYASTSIKAVLDKAGLRDRYFAESFSGLEELLAAVHDEVDAAQFADMMAGVDAAATPAGQVRQMLENYLRIIQEDPLGARVKLLESVGVSPAFEKRRQEAIWAYANATAARLPAPPPGSPLSPRILGYAFAVGMNGMFIELLAGSLGITGDQLVEHGMALFLGLEKQLTATTESQGL